jgi:hypothetical protein
MEKYKAEYFFDESDSTTELTYRKFPPTVSILNRAYLKHSMVILLRNCPLLSVIHSWIFV